MLSQSLLTLEFDRVIALIALETKSTPGREALARRRPYHSVEACERAQGELAEMVREIVYPEARLGFDASKPDGAPRKLLDVGRLHALRWKHTIELNTGIETSSAGSSSASTARGW